MWSEITSLGDAVLTLSVALACAIWLAMSNRRLAVLWMACLAAGVAFVGITKVLHAGLGVEIEGMDLRMISGHAMLATAVWTVTAALLLRGRRTACVLGIGAGLALGAATGAARVLDHSHTVAEAVAGWLTGALVAAVFLRACARAGVRPGRPLRAAMLLLFVSTLAYGRSVPLQHYIDEHSSGLCARILASVPEVL
jgi:membrane-associated phospholipid phosphatase